VIEVGSMRFRFQAVPHFTETFAIEIASMNGGGRITYGADCSPNEKLVQFAKGTDLLIVEATLPRPERTGVRGHLTPEEAGDHACRAGVKRVLLTHVSDELDELWVKRCAKRHFEGPIEVAHEGAVYEA
jgi:ribonuclease BN (tRNA processing enzyme)